MAVKVVGILLVVVVDGKAVGKDFLLMDLKNHLFVLTFSHKQNTEYYYNLALALRLDSSHRTIPSL